MIFDSHAHYDDKRFDDDRGQVLEEVFASGVGNILNIGSNLGSSRGSVELAARYPQIYATVGVHPHDTERTPEDTIAQLEEMARRPKVVAIGEIGLDYFYDYSDRDAQRRWFRAQMELAQRLRLPVVIHDREAHQECFDMIAQYPDVRGVFHCYAGSAEMARELIKLGYYISFTGIITFKNARRSHDVLRSIPPERLLVETDCPYLSPEPNRGQRNDSRNLRYTIAAMAEITGMPQNDIINITACNTRELFGIDHAN